MAQDNKSRVLPVSEDIQLNIIMKFIKPFDGDKNKLSPIIKKCDNAINLASSTKKNLLFKFILS